MAFAVLIRESKSLHNEIVSSEIVQKAASFLFLRFKMGLLLLLLFLVVKTTVSGKRIFRGAFHLPTLPEIPVGRSAERFLGAKVVYHLQCKPVGSHCKLNGKQNSRLVNFVPESYLRFVQIGSGINRKRPRRPETGIKDGFRHFPTVFSGNVL